jgi:UDP-N-acetylglucosamine diphosphorylase/glucosamine-1-phosphate N-acetyltransferase
MALALICFDDARARSWLPLSAARPVGELLYGARTLRQRAERAAGVACVGHHAGAALATFDEHGCAPGLVGEGPLASGAPRLFLCSRAVPDANARFLPPGASGAVRVGGRVLGWFSAPGAPNPDPAFLRAPEAATDAPVVADLPGTVLDHVWHLVTGLADRLRQDFAEATTADAPIAPTPAGVHAVGAPRGMLRIAPGATFEPGVVLDVTGGPIWIEEGVTIRAFTRLAGPAWIGPGTTLLGGSLSTVAIGPVCKVRGEVEASTLLGYTNKAHEGFLGHAYVGRWVNLGALTTNSDLKNNYGTVRLPTPAGSVDTGETKIGALIGDHAKTAIGTMLDTGSVIEIGASVFGAVRPPKHVPAFAWGADGGPGDYAIDRFLETAATMMGRRGVRLTDGQRAVLRAAWSAARR